VEYAWINAELAAMSPAPVAPTASRYALGVMRDFVMTVRILRADRDWDEIKVGMLEDRLAETPP
jgi:hypothetical protein